MKRLVSWLMHLFGRRTCREIVELLHDYYEDCLDPKVAAIVERHFRDCPDCDAFSRTYRAVIELTSDLACEDIPDEVQRRLHQALEEREGAGH